MVRYRSAAVDGLNIFYREAGDPKAPALLLLHGFPTSSHMFRDLLPLLADRYHLIAPDLPGFGFSDAPDRKRFDYTYPKFQEYFAAHRPPLLAVWGKNDPFFLPAGAEAFKRDNSNAEVRFLDTGHFALETHAVEVAAAIRDFLTRKLV